MDFMMNEQLYNDSTITYFSGNTTQTHDSNKSESLYYNTTQWHIATVLTGVLFFLIVLLNGMLICLLWRKTKWNKMDFFVLHLAIADLSMAVFYLFPSIVDRIMDEWLAGNVMCHLYMYTSMTVSYASTFMLVALSFDRVYAVVCPLSLTRKRVWYARLLVISVWIVSALLGIQDLCYAKMVTYPMIPNKEFCDLMYGDMGAVLVMINSVINVFIPAFLVTICFVLMTYVVWRRGSRGVGVSHINETDGHETERVNRNSTVFNRAKVRSLKMAIVVVLVFLMCWGPFTLSRILVVYKVTKRAPYNYILLVLAPLNSVANPIIIAAFNYKKLLQHTAVPPIRFKLTSLRTRTTILRKEQDSPEVCVRNGSIKGQLV